MSFVRLTHTRFKSSGDFFQALHEQCLKSRLESCPAFIDGVIFSDNEMYITKGEFVDTAPYLSNYTYMHIYYKSIRSRGEDYLTTSDYIWRWDADWFWCSKVFGMQNPLMRLFLGKWMLSSAVYAKIMHIADSNKLLRFLLNVFKRRSETVIQDILIPVENAGRFYDFYSREIGITPLWICPTFASKTHFDLCPLKPSSLYLDFGFWDSLKSSYPIGFFNRKIERETRDLGGFKSLYSDSYYSKEEFWDLYNLPQYEELKQKYDSQGLFKDLYQKVSRNKGVGYE